MQLLWDGCIFVFICHCIWLAVFFKKRKQVLFLEGFWKNIVKRQTRRKPCRETWTDGQTGGQTNRASALVLPGVQWSASVAVFRTIQLVPVCARPDQSVVERSNWIGSKWSLSSGGLTVSRVCPAAANNQPKWLTGSPSVARYAESFKSLCVCVCSSRGCFTVHS